MGAGAAAITCKAAFLGFLGGALALGGLSAIGEAALTAGVFIIAIPLVWRGFRWAGRKPAIAGAFGLAIMWLGYTLAGVLVTGGGPIGEGMMPADAIAGNPWGLVPVAAAYLTGTGLFGWAAYDSFGKEYSVSKSGMGVGIAGASVCGGCGITGIVGASAVLLTGISTNSIKFVGADLMMLIAALGVIAVTLYKRAWIQSATSALGAFIAVPLTRYFVTIPETAAGEVVGTLITFLGIAMLFYGLVRAYNPRMRVLPEEWSPVARVRNRA
jgi:hypothetical protein